MPELALLNCGQLVTLAGPARPRVGAEMRELAIIENAGLLVRDGKIAAAGASAEIEACCSSATHVIDAGRRTVLPGFVDAHTHPVFAGTRVKELEQRAAGATYAEIASQGGGILQTVRRTREATEDELFNAARRYAQWFLRGGTTTLEAKSGYGLSLSDELKILRVIRRLDAIGSLRYVPTFLGAHEIPDDFRTDPRAYVELVIHEMIPQVAAQNLADYCDVFCEPGIFDVLSSREILAAGRRAGMGLRVHADQFSRSGAAELAAEAGAITADHLEQIDEEGIAALARAGVQPVLLPASVLMTGSSKYAPARRMIEAGLAVVLATDFNPGSSPSPSIPFVLSLATTQMGMLHAEAITSVTINAAYSLGRGSTTGSLEKGKQADFVIHDCDDYREIGYFAGVETASQVVVGGELVFNRSL